MGKKTHSLINIVSRKRSKDELYYQARFFDKSGSLVKSVSLSGIKSRAEAYLFARQKMEQILSPVIPKEEIERYGILLIDEVRNILALNDDNLTDARNILISLLGITCGLSVSEICNLKREHITQNDMLIIETPHGNRFIPFIENVKIRLEKLNRLSPDCLYVIPNNKDKNKPCNPTSITRGLSFVLDKIGIVKERNINPSVLWKTFITLLVSCHKEIDMKTLDYLCSFDLSGNENITSKKPFIDAIRSLMMVLGKINFWTMGKMGWS